MEKQKERCSWAQSGELEIKYHDEEWGVPLHDDKRLFTMLILEGMQAGLSWSTILKKRKNFDEAFDHFDIEKISKYDQSKIDALMQDAGIIRNKLKIQSVIVNANAFLQVQKEFGSFDAFLWQYVNGTPIVNAWNLIEEVPANTDLSDRISKDLKKRGFKFIGTTIIYAYMQGIGMVNDHLTTCFCYKKNEKRSS